MLRWLNRLLATSLCTLILFGAFEGAAEAAVPRVSGVDVVGQNWCRAALKIRWNAVKGASYQLRWAHSKAGLRTATPIAVSRTKAFTGALPLTGKSYVQVRAVRRGHAGAWSGVRAGTFANRPLDKPALSGYGVPGGVRFAWGCTNYATKYRVLWAAAPHGYWPATTNYATGWLSQDARGATFGVPGVAQSGDHMLGVAYANPVWARLEAGNRNGGTRLSEGWTPVFPAPPDPGAGSPLRIGTYNALGNPGPGLRVNAIAANIAQHGLAVVALQEAASSTASAVLAALGPGWAAAPSGANSGQQILFRTNSYRYDTGGTITVTNWGTPSQPISSPWARLVPQGLGGRALYVASVHFTTNAAKSAMEQKRDNGASAQQVVDQMRFVPDGAPLVVAGDFNNLREPFGDTPGYVEAQPTFVRSGYYDSMAAVNKVNINYATFNGGSGTRQAPADSGVSSRTDYLMLKGFRGSNTYVNVVNWSWGGIDPSDHNLVYADLTVPFA